MTRLPAQSRDMYRRLLPPEVQGWVQTIRRHTMERVGSPAIQGDTAQIEGMPLTLREHTEEH